MSEIVGKAIDRDKYWAIHAKAIEWMFLIQKRLMKVVPKEAEDDIGFIVFYDEYPTYALKKQHITAEDISRVTGIPVERIEQAKTIELGLKEDRPDLPKQTVTYWGEA